MKAKIIIPIVEYGNITYEVEDTPESINETATYLLSLRKPKAGLSDKEMDAFIERQMNGISNHVEEYNRMTPEQQKFIQMNKRALNRIETKNGK